jgi:hypothetical protein
MAKHEGSNLDVHGLQYEAHVVRASLAALSAGFLQVNGQDVGIEALKISGPGAVGGEVFMVVMGRTSEGAAVVAFQSGADVATTLIGLSRRFTQGTLKWREDNYRE